MPSFKNTADRLPAALHPYVPFFCSVLAQVGAAGRSYEEMAERIAATTGGIRVGFSILDDLYRLGDFRVGVEVRGKALLRNQRELFAILADILAAADFSDYDRLYTVFNQIKVSLENSIPGSGHSYAARAAASRLTAAGRLREEWGGLHYIRLVRDIAARKPQELAETAECLRQIGQALLGAADAACSMTAEESAFARIREPLHAFLPTLPAGRAPGAGSEFAAAAGPMATGFAASVPVSYVARAFRTVPYTHADSASLMVLARLLRAGFLHREIREKGGAYGGMANFDAESGIFSMFSYRDPNLTRTLDVYRQAVDWVTSGDFRDEDIKDAILAVFASLDRPLSPGGRGHREFANQLQGLTREMRQELRQRVLGTDRQSLIATASSHLLEGWAQSRVAVISSEDNLRKANQELGGEGLQIEKI